MNLHSISPKDCKLLRPQCSYPIPKGRFRTQSQSVNFGSPRDVVFPCSGLCPTVPRSQRHGCGETVRDLLGQLSRPPRLRRHNWHRPVTERKILPFEVVQLIRRLSACFAADVIFFARAGGIGGICACVVCRESSSPELPFKSPEEPSVSASAPRARSFQEGDFGRDGLLELFVWP